MKKYTPALIGLATILATAIFTASVLLAQEPPPAKPHIERVYDPVEHNVCYVYVQSGALSCVPLRKPPTPTTLPKVSE